VLLGTHPQCFWGRIEKSNKSTTKNYRKVQCFWGRIRSAFGDALNFFTENHGKSAVLLGTH